MREREIPFNPTHLNRDNKTNQPWRTLLAPPMNQPIPRLARTLMGLEPMFALEQMRWKTSTAARSRSCAGDEQEGVAIEATDIHQA